VESIVLASGSLRRQEYFKLLNLPFKIIAPSIEEHNTEKLPAADFACKMAKTKLDSVIDKLKGKSPIWVFAADTVVELHGTVFTKPASREAAGDILKTLSGNEHNVITACALYNGRTAAIDCLPVLTKVRFAELSESDLTWYLETGEWQGAAGAYRIQGLGGCLITNISGSYSNVVGLPLREFYEMLIRNGYPYSA
jgi:septum formation protein